MIGKYINIPVFLISLALGVLFVYLFQPKLNVIYVYPTPDNIDKLQYKDKANNCFEFEYESIKCPLNQKEIKNIPVQ